LKLTFSPDGKYLALEAWGSEHGGNLSIHQIASNVLIREIYFEWNHLFAFSTNGAKYVSECPREPPSWICLYDLPTGSILSSFDAERTRWDDLLTISFSPHDDLLIGGTAKGRILIWDVRSGDLLSDKKGHNQAVNDISFSPDGKSFTSSSSDGTVVVWDIDRLS
jgi:WD40 repeat protein